MRTRSPVLLAAVVALALGSRPAQAENTVTQTITRSGDVTSFVIEETLGPLADPAENPWQTGRLRLVVDDSRGSAAGWSVSIAASDFTGAGDATGQARIPNTGFRLVVARAPTAVDGQPRGPGGPNAEPLFGASLDTARLIMQAAPGAGSGAYEQVIDVGLEIPEGVPGGAYEGVLVIAVMSGP